MITNDAKTAALGEMLFGNAREMKHFLVITIGTGLGKRFRCMDVSSTDSAVLPEK
jgi:hypothetical protein